MLFGHALPTNSFAYQYLSNQEPGTSETSRFPSDFINNPILINSIYRLGERLKLTVPEKDNHYAELVSHPKVVRVVALSGGYTREEGNRRLRRNHGIVASFSRALVEGLSARQSDAEYNALLDASIQSIFEASNT